MQTAPDQLAKQSTMTLMESGTQHQSPSEMENTAWLNPPTSSSTLPMTYPSLSDLMSVAQHALSGPSVTFLSTSWNAPRVVPPAKIRPTSVSCAKLTTYSIQWPKSAFPQNSVTRPVHHAQSRQIQPNAQPAHRPWQHWPIIPSQEKAYAHYQRPTRHNSWPQ